MGSLLEDLLKIKYNNAKATFDELSNRFSNKSEVWIHFHPQAGNTFSLNFGINSLIQLITIFSKSPKRQYLDVKVKRTSNFYQNAFIFGPTDYSKAKTMGA